MVKFTQSAPQGQGPSSAIGVQRFFDVQEGGPQLSPVMVFGAAIALIVIILAIKISGIMGV